MKEISNYSQIDFLLNDGCLQMSQNKKDPSDCLKNKRQKNKKQKNKKNLATGTTPGACF